jgi:hypothetical protein
VLPGREDDTSGFQDVFQLSFVRRILEASLRRRCYIDAAHAKPTCNCI